MNEGTNYLQTFNPAGSKPELLERTLIGRKDLVDRLEELVIESARSGNKLQRLIIGPRGSGKTHVLKVLHNRMLRRDELKNKLDIAYLCEEEYGVATFLDWIIRILKSFIRWYPKKANYLEGEIGKLKKVPPDDQERIAARILLNYIKGKTLLIIVENIGNIFDKIKGFGKKGQQKFRDSIQQHPYFTIMASNQALFVDIQKEDMPFHNFFKIIHLKKLSLIEAILFLKSISEKDENLDLINFLDTPEGGGRIKAIYHFIGGNHRLLVTFYHFLKADFINKLSKSFMKTINDLIPYYQSMMDILSSQQQKIVQYLSQSRKPCNVKNIAENCFSTQSTISKQMTNLVRLKYVDAIPSGRETFYELSEPLLRICNEVKENRGSPIKLFVDFLGNLYSVEEIKRKYMYYHILTKVSEEKTSSGFWEEQLYYKEALKQYFPDIVKLHELDKFEKAEKDYQIKTFIEELEQVKAYPEILKFTSKIKQKDRYLLLKESSAYGKIGDVKKEIETAKLLLKKDEKDIDTLLLLAEALYQNEKFAESDKYLRKVLKIDTNNIDALNGLGRNLLFQDKYEEGERYFVKLLSIEPNNKYAIEMLGVAVGNQDDYQQAYEYFKKLIKLQPDYSKGWRLLGLAQENLGEIEEAKASYLKAIELDEKNSNAIEFLGILLGEKGEYQQAYNYFKKLIKLQPDYSEGWRLLGLAQKNLGEIEEAKASYLKAIELDEKNLGAITSMGVLLIKEHNFEKAKFYFDKVLKEKLGDSHILRLIGELYRVINQFKNAIPFYQQAIEADLKDYWSYLDIVSCQLGLNKIEDALSELKHALKIAAEVKLTNQLIQTFEENLTTLFIYASQENISAYLTEALTLIEKYGYTDQFYKSIPETIFDILKEHDKIKIERFEFIEGYLNNKFKEDESMIIPLKFLNIGIRHLKKKEKNALLQFTKEERAIFKKFVSDKIKKE